MATYINPGLDDSGNSNNWTINNINWTSETATTYDVMNDVPSLTSETQANYAVLNFLSKGSAVVLSQGNLLYGDPTTTSNVGAFSTIGMSSGKWYCEATVTGNDVMVGLSSNQDGAIAYVGATASGWGYYNINGQKYNNGSGVSYGATYTTNDVIGIAFDADNGTLTFYKNNVSQGTAFTGLTSGPYYFATGNGAGGTDGSVAFNFGQRPFVYSLPSGFKALNTFNLPTPTIGATASTQANKYMDVVTYAGNGGTQSISSLAFQPDWVWIKDRTSTGSHYLVDAVRGRSSGLSSNSTSAELISGDSDLTSFNSNGFTVKFDGSQNFHTNTSGRNFVGWAWDANGTGVTNTAGSITSTVSANTSSGFSIVTYTGTGTTTGYTGTVGHGLGVAPKMIIVKNRGTAGENWIVYHASLGATKGIQLNLNNAETTYQYWWKNTAPTSSVFSVGYDFSVGANGENYVAYCFSEVSGFSRFGSYTGNGSADGTFVFTGFRPRYVVIKRADSGTDAWVMHDTARSPLNTADETLLANSSIAEISGSSYDIDILSNGFKIRTTNSSWNTSGSTYIYMAFAENPFKYSLAR